MTRNFNSKSIILTRRPLGEKNVLLKLFTEQFGLIDVVAYGARGMNSKLRVVNGIGTTGTAYLYMRQNRSLSTLREFDTDPHQQHGGNVVYHFLYLSLWTEVLIATFGSGSEYHQSFALLSAALVALRGCSCETHYRLATARFLWRYLRLNGSAPDLTRCTECDAPFANTEAMVYAHSHLYCPHCFEERGENDGVRYSTQLTEYFVHRADTPFAELLKSDWVLAQASELFEFALLCMQQVIGYGLKSLRVIAAFDRSYSI